MEFLSPREQEVRDIADRIVAEWDRIAFEGLSRILEEVRRQNAASTPEGATLVPSSVEESEIPPST